MKNGTFYFILGFINKCLRKILIIRWPEVISNEELWERTQQIHIEEGIMRRKWKWIRHTLPKPENNITRCALEWNPQGSRRTRIHSLIA